MAKNTRALKKKLDVFFAEMTKLGYTARQNFKCCQNCGWSALTAKEAKKAVFYHNQDNDELKENGELYICWSGNGKLIKKTAEQCGITVDWDGNKLSRMLLS